MGWGGEAAPAKHSKMLEIFKYFVGIIGVLILVYVLIVILRTVLQSGFVAGSEIASATSTSNTVASTTNIVLNWFKNIKPITMSPIYVGYDQNNAQYSFFGNNENKGYKTQSQLYWQNLGSAPNSHPTDWVPVDKNYQDTFSYEPNKVEQENEIKPSDRYIFPNIRPIETVYDNQVVTGRAFYKVFSKGQFMVYVLDRNTNTVGEFKMFANGSVEDDFSVDFRGVIDTDQIPINSGYLMFKNDNTPISGIKAVTVVPVLFAK